MMEIMSYIAMQISIRCEQVEATVRLLDDNNTIPFIARYRKEMTGGLDEEQLREIEKLLRKTRTLEERKLAIIKTLDELGKLTPDLKMAINDAETLTSLEDLYQPYKQKRRTRASIAGENGLLGLAEWIIKQPVLQASLEDIAKPFVNDTVLTIEDAASGARDIVAEMISDHPEVRRITREKFLRWGKLVSEKIVHSMDERSVYERYYHFECQINRLRPHQLLAINRGETEKMRIVVQDKDWRNAITSIYCPNYLSTLAGQLELTINDAAARLLLPAIERDVRRELKEKADNHAIRVFSKNLRALLFQPPLMGQHVMGIDPGFRTGCKIAVVDPTGKLLNTETIYPHAPQHDRERSLKLLAALVNEFQVTIISIGNGTASRETEQLIAELIRHDTLNVKYVIVNEAGASVYSASPLARSELPTLDVSLRGAVSIARRIQDPLSELVKIEPKSIGVGLYQHDVNQSLLSESLNVVVESVVNQIGVDLATASPALLSYISGVGRKLAERIVEYRNQNGEFTNRFQLSGVPGFGPKAFEQAAGFLRIQTGENPLDSTAIHPESYPIAEKLLANAKIEPTTPRDEKKNGLERLLSQKTITQLAEEYKIGEPTLVDIIEQLIRPGRDPREEVAGALLRSDVLSMEDLAIGMQLKGTVRNVVDFGIFVDIGVKQDGLLHRSQLPSGVQLNVGDVIHVEVLKIEVERGRIGLRWVEANDTILMITS
jgi:uncharacterized protein